MRFKQPRKTVEFLVRYEDRNETLPAEYTPSELALMGRLREQVDAAEPGSVERQEAMNSLFTIHEMKALLDAELEPK